MSGSQVKPHTEFGSFRTVSRSTRTWSGRPWALSGRSRTGAGGTRAGFPATPGKSPGVPGLGPGASEGRNRGHSGRVLRPHETPSWHPPPAPRGPLGTPGGPRGVVTLTAPQNDADPECWVATKGRCDIRGCVSMPRSEPYISALVHDRRSARGRASFKNVRRSHGQVVLRRGGTAEKWPCAG